MEVWSQWILVVCKNLNVQAAITGLGNLEVKISIDKSQRSRGQIIDSNKERYLSGLHNNNSGLEMELV